MSGLSRSKYAPLRQFLLTSNKDCMELTFLGLNEILGFPLPQSAHSHRAWWSNGGHSHAQAWLKAGYRVKWVKPERQAVCFCKGANLSTKRAQPQRVKQKKAPPTSSKPTQIVPSAEVLNLYGYKFYYLQSLMPKCDADGHIISYYPQKRYNNKDNLPLSSHGKGAFCRFSITAGNWPGVYLWIINSKIIYIGETDNLKRRFNMGYGIISPRNCYIGGQSTNCKMNKVVLDFYKQGKIISLYFYKTVLFKQVELELLGKINTPYNVKDN